MAGLRAFRVLLCERCIAGRLGPCRRRGCLGESTMLTLEQQSLVNRIADTASPAAIERVGMTRV